MESLKKTEKQNKFSKQDAEKVAAEFKLDFPVEDILEGLNIELEHKDITGGDLEETAKIVIAHLKERPDYYKRLKKYVETKDNDPVKTWYNFNNILIAIEWYKGDVREYPNSPYKNVMGAHYGYIVKTKSQDGEELDVYVKPESNKKTCFLLTQLIDNKFDEYKYMLGFNDLKEARQAYLDTMPFEMCGEIVEIEWDKFLKEHLKFYKSIKDSSFLISDAVSIHNKKATIMRDGYYKYLAKEVDRNANYPMDIVNVYRPPEEVKKAYDRFVELVKLPAIANHPENDLDLTKDSSYADGEGVKPELRIVNGQMLLDCELNLKGKAKEFYDKGIKEISCGWHGEYEKVNDDTLDYQYIQRFKDFNHIAILERGRCGSTCSIKDKEIQKDEVLDMTKEELEQLVNDKVNSIFDSFIEDGKAATVGETREWQGGKFKKVASGKWEKVGEDKKENKLKEETNEQKVEKLVNDLEKIKNIDEVYKYLDKNNYSYRYETPDQTDDYFYDTLKIFMEEDNQIIVEFKQKILEQREDDEPIISKEIEGFNVIKNINDSKIINKKGEFNGTEEEIEDAYLNGDEDEDDLEKAKGKLKKFKDCWTKMKAKKIEVKDEDALAIYDKKIEDAKIAIRDAFVENSKGTYESIEMGILNSKEVVGKTPCEIKAMVIKKVLDKDVSINDMAIVNTLFDVALKNYENPKWNKKVNIKDGLVGIDALREKSRNELEKIATGKI